MKHDVARSIMFQLVSGVTQRCSISATDDNLEDGKVGIAMNFLSLVQDSH